MLGDRDAQPIEPNVQAAECDPREESPSSSEPAVELKIEPALKSESDSKSKYAAALKGETAPLIDDPGWFDLDQRRDRIIANGWERSTR